MQLYLLDTNVLQELGPGGHRNVRAWIATVPDASIRLSALTFQEIRMGWEKLRKRDAARAEKGILQLNAIMEEYEGRILPIDHIVAAEWGRLRGESDKHAADMALAATARVHNLVIVTRNVDDFKGRGVRVLNPFKAKVSVVVL